MRQLQESLWKLKLKKCSFEYQIFLKYQPFSLIHFVHELHEEYGNISISKICCTKINISQFSTNFKSISLHIKKENLPLRYKSHKIPKSPFYCLKT